MCTQLAVGLARPAGNPTERVSSAYTSRRVTDGGGEGDTPPRDDRRGERDPWSPFLARSREDASRARSPPPPPPPPRRAGRPRTTERSSTGDVHAVFETRARSSPSSRGAPATCGSSLDGGIGPRSDRAAPPPPSVDRGSPPPRAVIARPSPPPSLPDVSMRRSDRCPRLARRLSAMMGPRPAFPSSAVARAGRSRCDWPARLWSRRRSVLGLKFPHTE